ncbi:MAG: DUF3320 domain-containing protein, partial [Geminicoccaceae bacterium]|nr:DUF3320 domain-containing protein [Geminicoccaceae bacterium]
GCFSIQQRDRILFELERLRQDAPELEPFFVADGSEPFFVKNLEALQGDERDVIMISVGYGRDSSGYLAMTFGPLNAEGGERRLNVLISRARQRLEVITSITAADIDLARSSRPGVRALKTFLQYAETGVLGAPAPSGREPDSPFELAVEAALRRAGLEVVHQVGSAGFFVDLAVVDPERPGRYLLGIECDGAAWHSARWARDRDRLRQQVLEDQGWIIHRVWSGDWFRRPEATLRRTLEAVEAAKATWRARDTAAGAPASEPATARPRPTSKRIARAPAAPPDAGRSPSAPAYVEADFALEPPVEPHLMAAPQLRTMLTRIVEIEGPVHQDEIARRLTRLAGLSRTGRRIAQTVAEGLQREAAAGRLQVDRGFYALPGREVTVRERSGVVSSTLRRPALLPPAEIEQAVLELVRRRGGMSADEAVVQAGRMLGFQSTSAPLRRVIEASRDRLIEAGILDPDERGLLRERRSAA